MLPQPHRQEDEDQQTPGPAVPATPGLDPELSRLRGGAEAGERWFCSSSEGPSRLSGVREIILDLLHGWRVAVPGDAW